MGSRDIMNYVVVCGGICSVLLDYKVNSFYAVSVSINRKKENTVSHLCSS